MAPGGIDPRDFGALERDVQHLADRIERLEATIKALNEQIGTLTTLLNQARGGWKLAAWVIGGAISLGAFGTAMVKAWGRGL